MMGYQPGLDGLRAISVAAVILYHAGFSWMHGGFLGVEVFFVVSGYLITSLLLEERQKSGRVSLSQFWLRRARRLFPALFMVFVAVATWAMLFGSAEQTSQLKRDLPWAIPYAANWGQIAGDVPYFQPGDPPLLRHLWSLAVEEQWYLIWPLAFIGLMAWLRRPERVARALGIVVFGVFVLMWWIERGGDQPLSLPGVFDGADRVNFLYLSTITRSMGLLLGAAAAMLWQPWRWANAMRAPSRALDIGLGASVGVLLCCFLAADLTAGYMYPWLLTLVSLASLVAIAVVVHPAAAGSRLLLSWPPLVEFGKRSYGVYLWHWPIFVVLEATDGSTGRFFAGVAITAVVSELCYRFVETPVRKGALGRWMRSPRREQRDWVPVGALGVLVLGLGVYYVQVDEFDVAAGGGEATFDLAVSSVPGATTADTQTSTQTGSTIDPNVSVGSSQPVGQVAAAPRSLAIVGDSQAHSLAVNLPEGIESTFTVEDGAVDGCSVFDTGNVISSRDGFSNSFDICETWAEQWGEAAAGNDVALVVLGAWDVFDIEIDGRTYVFASPEFDSMFTSNLQRGIDAITAAGAKVALLEVACMRPQDVEGAGVPALPERADDSRVAHLNDLLRGVAAAQPGAVTFVEGPSQWCDDPTIASDLKYRWDGVHVYKPGAELIYETIAQTLLQIP